HGDHRRIERRRQLRDVRPRLRAAALVHVAEWPNFGDGWRTGGQYLADGEAAAASGQAPNHDASRAGNLRRTDSRQIRGGKQPLLFDGPVVGRRGHRSRRNTRRAWPRSCRSTQRADSGYSTRCVSDVSEEGSYKWQVSSSKDDERYGWAPVTPKRRSSLPLE